MGETISLSATALSIAQFPFDWLVNLGVLSTRVLLHNLAGLLQIKQIIFSRSSGGQPTTHYKLCALEVQLRHGGTMSPDDIPFLLGSDFATTLEHLNISCIVFNPSKHHFGFFAAILPDESDIST
jgi:hypothetical protein